MLSAKRRLAAFAALSALCTPALAQSDTADRDSAFILRADVSQTSIVFQWDNDLWLSDRDGGNVRRLTARAGVESEPRFSPDGSHVAFSAAYDGRARDVYVASIEGGEPRRLTFHPAEDVVSEWSPEGERVLFASDRQSERARYRQLYAMAFDGGAPTRLAPPYAEVGALSEDARYLYFTATRDFQEEAWKRYQGGRAPDLWRMDVQTLETRTVALHPASDSAPMLAGDTVYFLSERSGRSNLWAARGDEAPRQLTDFGDEEVRFPAIGAGEIIFSVNGRLHLLDLASEAVRRLDVDVSDAPPMPARRTIVVDDIVAASIAPDASAVAFEARGDVFVIEPATGLTRNLTATSASAEAQPWFGADGSLYYASDASGEYAIVDAAAGGEVQPVSRPGRGFPYRASAAPRGNAVAYVDDGSRLHLLDRRSRTDRIIDQLHGREASDAARSLGGWSPDGRYFVYSAGEPYRNQSLWVADARTGARTRITSGFYSDTEVVVSADGRYLFALSQRRLAPTTGDVDTTWTYARSASISVMPLVARAPLPGQPGWEEEDTRALSQPDWANAEARLGFLDVPAGELSRLVALSSHLLYLRRIDGKANLVALDLRSQRETVLAEDILDFDASSSGSILVRRRDKYQIVSVDGGAPQDLSLQGLAMEVDTRAEGREAVRQAWRAQRDRFYDAGLHNLDWDNILERSLAAADRARTAEDISFIVADMLGELEAGHVYVSVGPRNAARDPGNFGFLGADLELRGEHYVIARILAPGVRAAEVRSPLIDAGVRDGEYLLSVNGRALGPEREAIAAFEGLGGQYVELVVNSRPTTQGARTVRVRLLSDERMLRELVWVEANRRYVERASNGRIGYIYVRDTAESGQTQLMLQYKAQVDREALIIDERFNAGGALGDRLVELLNRPTLASFRQRYGPDYSLPELAHDGPMAMLINGWSLSGGDGFPLLFQAAERGPLIGTQTWGAYVGPTGVVQLVNGVQISAPPQRVFTTSGAWAGLREESRLQHGAQPDIEVVNNPGVLAQGRDQQLDAAIAYLEDALANLPAPAAAPIRTPEQE